MLMGDKGIPRKYMEILVNTLWIPMVSSKSCEKVGFVFSIFLGGAIPEKHSECGMSRDDTVLGVCGGGGFHS